MAKAVYHIRSHDGGWAYEAQGVFSETFATREEAHQAAERVAREQRQPGDTAVIWWEDAEGKWREETARGGDRPETEVLD